MTHVDGNALAGPLSELFAFDLTTAVGRCLNCGASGMIGDAMVYLAAPGTVARCPHCDEVLATLVEADDRVWLSLRGISALEVRRRP
ncbi:DUF6510 family protein [Lysinimonas soli]|uniref:DUF6510 family protein n=1 Tax=Lysinimonas soli TaxID=1074233 RepID=A0ABW0NT61_9MICO